MLRDGLLRCMHQVAGELVAAADATATSGAPAGLPGQLRVAAQRLQGWTLEGLGNVQETEQLLQHAAALMQQYHTLPAVEEERQLAVAQAAAGRSCAYLRCANLGGEGGPTAGQGAGSMRCGCDRDAARLARLALWVAGIDSIVHGKLIWHALPSRSASLTRCTASLPAVPAARCGTAAPPARTPTGGRAGTAACARRWARRGGRLRRRQRGKQARCSRAAEECVCAVLFVHKL